MTKFDAIKQMTKDEMADFLCHIRADKPSLYPCSDCTAVDYCRAGKCGFLDWLDEVQDDG